MTSPPFAAFSREERLAGASRDTWGAMEKVLAPLAVEVQPTALCHRTCVFCSHIVRNRRGGELTGEEVSSLLDELRSMGVKGIAFSGGGEPLFWHAARVVDAIELAAGFADVTLTTSGDQLWEDDDDRLHPDAVRVLRACRAMYLNVPAVDEDSYARQIKGSSNWKRTAKLIRAMVALKRADPNLQCEIQGAVVLSVFNADQVEAIDRELCGAGVDDIYYKQFKNFESRNVSRIRLETEQLLERLEHVPVAVRSPALSRFISGLRSTDTAHVHCWANRLAFGAIVDPNGDVYLCTPTVGKPEYCIGSLSKGGFRAVWSQGLRDHTLRRLNQMSISGACPAECRYHDENRTLNHLIEPKL